MAGDRPCEILDRIISKISDKAVFVDDYIEFETKTLKDTLNLIEDEIIKEERFVFPFYIIRILKEGYPATSSKLKNILQNNQNLSERIKKMIGDGGSKHRGYPGCKSCPENNYNNFKTPWDCAKQLYDSWDKIIAGENIPLKQEIGLFEKFESHPPGDGLINVQ